MTKKLKLFKRLFYMLVFTLPFFVVGQTVKGRVLDKSGAPVPFASVIEKGTVNGIDTDINGSFSFKANQIPAIIIVSSVGFKKVEIKVTSSKPVEIVLHEDNALLDEVVLTGNRSKPRTILNSPVPIDNIGVKELKTTGQTSVDQMLTYAVPSYNSTSQTISDATAHFDPADLRGLGPSRTLVLVNGKRKNQSALVYVNDTPGKGEVGTDMKSIPTAAIERVEVLRDGASAQYGSDAVAGVVNIILKKNIDFTEVNVSSGITKEGDGFNANADVNHTISYGKNGFLNASLNLGYQDYTNRSGEPGKDDLFEVENEWTKKNPSLGMTVGQPVMKKGDLFLNTGYSLSEKTKLYGFGGFNYRKGKSFALYRVPYWVEDPYNLLHAKGTPYNGFQPEFRTDIMDAMLSLGSNFELLGFDSDLSATYGVNKVDYTISNTINPDLGASSPTEFEAGGYDFSHIVGNFDMSKSFGDVSVGLGTEARYEMFGVTAGEEASYKGKGAQSFPGLQPSNALNESRHNIGVYGTVDWDITPKFLVGGAIRYENYSDFGGNISWKLNSRYKINDAGTIRMSYSTGFRAPSLHQVYLSNIQTLVSGGTISDQGTFNNVDDRITQLGVESLFAETSRNFSAGLTIKGSKDLSISMDYYRVVVDDRVLFTGEVGFDRVGQRLGDDLPGGGKVTIDNVVTTNEIEEILKRNKLTSIKFFINAFNTVTNGFDFVIRQKNIALGSGKLGVNLALNLNHTELDGEIKVPEKLTTYKNAIFNRKEQSRVISARPNSKFLFGLDYKLHKFTAAFNNTYFGEVTWQHATDVEKDQTFKGKIVTDLSLGYTFSEHISANFIVNNLFDVYPDEINPEGDPSTDLGGRFKYPWEVNQFGFNGMTFKASLNFKF